MTATQTEARNGDQPHVEALSDSDFKQALADVAPHLRAFGRSLCGCRDRADDLAQETMMRAWAARDRYHAGTNFKAWTFTILRNQFYSEARRNRFRGDYDEGMAERTLRAPAAQEDAVALSDVMRALSVLPDTHREALILVAVGNLSYEEIADICGIALGTVKSRICRARAMLAHTLESGKLPDFRHNFVLSGQALDAFFGELAKVANAAGSESGSLNMYPARGPLPTILIVEDEFLVALDLESIAVEAGYLPVGTAPDRATVDALPTPQIALVDLNLRDGATGAAIARDLSRKGAAIVYVTANPAQIGEPAPTAIGVVQKPYSAETVRRVLACANKAGPAPALSSDFTPLRAAA